MKIILPLLLLFFAHSVYTQKKPQLKPIETRKLGVPPSKVEVKTVSIPATTTCNVEAANLLPIRNLKIGMDATEIKKIFPKLQIQDSYQKYVQSGSILFIRDSDKTEGYQDVKSIYVHFVDFNLVGIRIDYEPDIEWESIDEYKEQVSKAMNIPPTAWSISSINKYGSARAVCKDFTIDLAVLKITNEISYSFDLAKKNYVLDAINKEKEEIENKKKNFKP
ncbi:MAG TPA: hypothetical protein PKY59_21955 [Pyrinomonadaceae bacterium]|nr:hypothetical protein [Pyrinomonadaceae bacterium]